MSEYTYTIGRHKSEWGIYAHTRLHEPLLILTGSHSYILTRHAELLSDTTIQVECQYCGCDLGTKQGHGKTGVSHGVCEDCAKKELP